MPWTEQQDKALQNAVASLHGKGRQGYWVEVAKLVFGGGSRAQAQACQQRWVNYADPSIVKTALTEDEKVTILNMNDRAYTVSCMASSLTGRTQNQVKSWIRSKKRQKEMLQLDEHKKRQKLDDMQKEAEKTKRSEEKTKRSEEKTKRSEEKKQGEQQAAREK